MTLQQDIGDEGLLDLMDDTTGLLEIQKGLQEIEKLQKSSQEEQDEEVLDSSEGTDSQEEVVETGEPEETEEEDISLEEIPEESDKKEKKPDKYRKLQNDKYRALAEKAAAEERIKELEQMLDDSMSSGTYHYGKNVYADLDKAKEAKRKAIREGDEDAYLEADVALIKAINTVTELEKWAAENKTPQKSISVSQNENIDSQIKEEMAMDWLETHPYLQPVSRSYNPALATKVAEFVNQLDSNLERKNNTQAYYTPAYFNTIDKYIDSIKTSPRKTSNIETLPTVGGVRNSYAGPNKSASSKTQVTLTADEKTMAMIAGIDEKDWARNKEEMRLEELKNRKRA